MERLDVVVVGAGQAGLTASYFLQQRGCTHVVLERGRVGESWRSQRWDSFVMNTPNAMTTLAGQSSVHEDAEGFMSRDGFVEELERYVRDLQLPVRVESPVLDVRAERSGGGFTISTGGRAPAVLSARCIVVASGIMQRPNLPTPAALVPADIAQVHTSEYRNPVAVPPGAVLVVGSAQSGCQIAEDLLNGQRRVYLSTSKVGRSPRRHRGRDALAWMVDIGAFDVPLEQLEDLDQRFEPPPQISGVGPRGHTVSLQWLSARGATLLGHFDSVEGRTARFANDLADNIRFGDDTSAKAKRQIDEYIEREGIRAQLPSVDPADQPCADPEAFANPLTLDLDDAGIRTIVWCTGFTADFNWLHLPVVDDHGAPVHDHGRAPVRGLFFLGFPWLRQRGSGIVYGVAKDAELIVEELIAQL